MLRACALVLLCGVPVASPALVSPIVACSWLLPCATPGSGAVGGLHPEDAAARVTPGQGEAEAEAEAEAEGQGQGQGVRP